MKAPNQENEHIILAVEVQNTRILPLAKGGGVVTAGASVTQADLRASHDANAKRWTNAKGGVERYYEVFAVGESWSEIVGEGESAQEVIHEAPEVSDELATQRWWYFPSDEGRPGRGLTLPNGVSTNVKPKAAQNAGEGDISADNTAPAKPVVVAAAKPVVVAAAAKPAAPIMAKKPLIIARKA